MTGHSFDVVLSVEFVAAVFWVVVLMKFGTRRRDPLGTALALFFVVLGAIVVLGLAADWLPLGVVRRLPTASRIAFAMVVNILLPALCLESRVQWRRRKRKRREEAERR